MARIVLGVAGGIAAYKACSLLRLFTEAGHRVDVVPTRNALNFVGETTWAALSGRPVRTDVWDDAHEVPHVALGRAADLVVAAPATADLLARAAVGRADDLLTNILLTATCPVVMAPAMHTEMWRNPATADNVARLRGRGVVVMEPAVGRLTGADTGQGRLPEPDEIAALAISCLDRRVAAALAAQDLVGRRVVVSAGGTREALDPVRFVGNASSGKTGVALARAARQRGAETTLVAANLAVEAPSGVRRVDVVSTGQLAEAMAEEARGADIVVMAAAVADFAPEQAADSKIKKSGEGGLVVRLRQTEDILAGLAGRAEPGQVVVGFAAETAGDDAELLRLGRAKLARKGCRLLVVNNVSGGAVFGADETAVVILDRDEPEAAAVESGPKEVVAHAIIERAAKVCQS
ncbi:MAG: bifunctional phosphopantothenoylcysteine decarboxylase/phosphopantothenate--cysteine ligase CoaBC [Propionibacteriaceae bacterium]|jgi:phosphopantothenoylcysteine decarboxylase/phosphopantothenate--cysteine ligase|nr:bifunctional phosphopantothenoylcysteine decarboxylase/phosphopantothenate--cysteine ligase CoaBC [Propionibacteriaceae bacterium]